jgi:cytochrome c6
MWNPFTMKRLFFSSTFSARRTATRVLLSLAAVLSLGSAGFAQAGFAQYNRTCAQCHGRNMVQAGVTVYDLRRFPIDDKERFLNSVINGKGNGSMPGFKDALTQQQIELVWIYVKNRGKAPE